MSDRKNWLPSVSTCWRPDNFPEMFRALVREDIHHIELSGGRTTFWDELDFVHQNKKVVQDINGYDIEIASMHLPFCPFKEIDPTIGDPEQRQKIIAYQGELLRAGADAGIPIAVLHPSGEHYNAFERGDRMKCAIETLHALADIAVENGIKLAIENLPRTCLGNIHEEMTLMLNEVPSLFACFDTNHSLRQPNPDLVRAMGSRIITIHASDYDMIDERHLLPFLGRNDWHEIMAALEEVGYDGYFTFEVGSKGVLPEKALRMSYDKLMEI